MGNEELRAKYDAMHKQGVTSWFSDGREERETILKMGEPWEDLDVLEIGCGEGDLAIELSKRNAFVDAIDYSETAINKAIEKHGEFFKGGYFNTIDYRNIEITVERIVMQGVLEHLDDPFTELKWMMDNLLGEHGDVITSSPCFLNPRGIVWMTLDMLGAVMSKTDLHYLNPWEFMKFCDEHGYTLNWQSCDLSWGHDEAMINDLMQRIPLALKDGKLPLPPIEKLSSFLHWLGKYHWGVTGIPGFGATMVYKISKG